MDGAGRAEGMVKLPPEDLAAQLECHEPRPLVPRPREPVIQPRVKPEEANGRFLLADVNHGRNEPKSNYQPRARETVSP